MSLLIRRGRFGEEGLPLRVPRSSPRVPLCGSSSPAVPDGLLGSIESSGSVGSEDDLRRRRLVGRIIDWKGEAEFDGE